MSHNHANGWAAISACTWCVLVLFLVLKRDGRRCAESSVLLGWRMANGRVHHQRKCYPNKIDNIYLDI